MRSKTILKLVLACTGFFAIPAPGHAQTKLTGYQATAPLTHDNLSVYFLHGKDDGLAAPLALNEAVAGGEALVHLSPAREVVIDNLSSRGIFVQAGDLLLGGLQDQVVGTSLLVPPNSTGTRIETFCVENGRSEIRGDGNDLTFVPVRSVIPSDIARLSMASGSPQTELAKQMRQFGIWLGVESLRARLSDQLGKPVASSQSPSSLPLALEDAAVDGKIRPYLNALEAAADSDRDILGAVFAIDGRWVTADVYSSNTLFRQMWPKLLRANIIRSIASRSKVYETAPLDGNDMMLWNVDTRQDGSSLHKVYVNRSAMQTSTLEQAILTSLESPELRQAHAEMADMAVIEGFLQTVYDRDPVQFKQAIQQALGAGLFSSRRGLQRTVEDAVAAGGLRDPREFRQVIDRFEAASVRIAVVHARPDAEAALLMAQQVLRSEKASRNAELRLEIYAALAFTAMLALISIFFARKFLRARCANLARWLAGGFSLLLRSKPESWLSSAVGVRIGRVGAGYRYHNDEPGFGTIA
jgi:hypothetical protein